uniref:Uncharacterized protein n=1 Tax=Anguilla anguilla TaxID=7936 RepID=A0A0E9XH32_ANGAN
MCPASAPLSYRAMTLVSHRVLLIL